jgi:5'-nucleotidase
MTCLDHHRIRQLMVGAFASTLAVPVLWMITPMAAQAAACTQIVSGAHSGVINVAANQKLCLRGAVQDGAVNVAPGGALSVVSSTITGAVTLKSGYTELEFCGSKTVRGAISATGGRGSVVIGGSGLLGALLCPANTIDGAVTLDANKAGVQLARSGVAGAVTASANLGGTTISGNQIGGKLTCSANVPAPTNAGAPNAVAGGRVGQTCAVLSF